MLLLKQILTALKRKQITCHDSSKKLLCIKVKQVYKNAFKQKENQKVQLGVSWY